MKRIKEILYYLSASALALGLTFGASTAFSEEAGTSLENYGTSVSGNRVDRTIVVQVDCTYVNVKNGEKVRFVVKQSDGSERSFAWRFDVFPGVNEVAMSKVAPAGLLDHDVRIYVIEDLRSPS